MTEYDLREKDRLHRQVCASFAERKEEGSTR